MANSFSGMHAAPISFTDRKILVLDDMPDMRSTMRNQMQSLGITNISLAGTVKEALNFISQRTYDVILCDYYLGGNTDGQQFLEYLRSTNTISRATLFIMITAETGFNSVITAAECLPDDYLLKPFTGETLKVRLEKLLERKSRLAAIDRLQDAGDWNGIVHACDDIIFSKDKYMIDAMRIKGNALIMLNHIDEAIMFYQDALKMRDMPWAKLGLAKALKAKGQSDQSEHLLEDIIRENPKLLAAYDLLGKIHTEAGQHEKALVVLENACKIAPHSLARQRSIANLAEETGDFSRVDKAMSVVVKQTKNSPLRDARDFSKLTNALNELGELERSVGVLKEAKESFKDAADVTLISALEAVTYQKSGDHDLARQALEQALANQNEKLPESTSMAIAQACLANHREDEAMEILKNVVQNNPDSHRLHTQIAILFKDHGGNAAAKELIERSVKEVISLNNEAVKKAKAGGYTDASQMLIEAAHRLPNNLQIVSNAALSILMDMFVNGFDPGKANQARVFTEAVIRQNKHYPKLAEITALNSKVRHKYNMDGTL